MRASGDLEAFCRREYPRLVGSLSLHCGDTAVAEELAQETLARVCDRWDKVRGMNAPGAWAHRVGINLANSYYRRRKAERRANARHGDPHAGGHRDEDVAGAVAVRQAVAGLPPKQRAVVALRFFLGLSVAETAAVMQVGPDAVKQHTRRAVVALRGRFDPDHVQGESHHHG